MNNLSNLNLIKNLNRIKELASDLQGYSIGDNDWVWDGEDEYETLIERDDKTEQLNQLLTLLLDDTDNNEITSILENINQEFVKDPSNARNIYYSLINQKLNKLHFNHVRNLYEDDDNHIYIHPELYDAKEVNKKLAIMNEYINYLEKKLENKEEK